MTGDVEDAIENFNHAIVREQKYAVLWNELGAALVPVRPKEAEVALRRALPPVTRRRLSRHRII